MRATPSLVALTGGATTVTLDAGAGAALQSLGVTAAPIGSDSLAFPITGGRVDAKTFAGTITHSGGISLTKGATKVELTDFEIGIDDTPRADGARRRHARADPDRRPERAASRPWTAGRSRSPARA